MRSRDHLILLLSSAILGACTSSISTPVHQPLLESAERTPVVLVPGITGSKLRDRATGKLAWGVGRRIITPRDGAYALALPLGDPRAGRDLEPDGVIEELRLLGIRREIYGPILRLLEANGYQRGDLAAPQAGDTLFAFSYDWRRDNEHAVQELAAALERVRRVRGVETLEVDLICQSNGAHICRYLAKYGGASFADADAGRTAKEHLAVRKVILAGTANGGSLRILRELDRGRSYFPVLGRKMRPEVLFTFPALYQDLPSYRDRYFLAESGRELEVDLYDANEWDRHGWSIFAPAARRRVRKHQALFGEPDEWKAFLETALERARLLQRLLKQDATGFGASGYYLIQSPSMATPDRGVLLREEDGYGLFFTGDKALMRRPGLHDSASTHGDGHAGVMSQLWLSPQECAVLVGEPLHVKGDHFALILAPETLEYLLEVLAK